MNINRKYIYILSIFLFLALGTFGVSYYLSFRNITFNIVEADTSIDIYQQFEKTSKKVTGLAESKNIRLQDGQYYYVSTSGEKYSTDKNSFTVDKDSKKIDVNLDYSVSYLNSKLRDESVEIKALIGSKYASVIGSYSTLGGSLYKKGEWYGTIIRKKVSRGDIADDYRVVLHKIDGKWTVVNLPEIVLLKSNYPDVPIEILNSINDLK